MADAIQTYAYQFKGGLVTNLSPLQQGVEAPGSARILRNFEPSVQGGYMRIQGFAKYDTAFVPAYGFPKVQGGSQTGTTLILGNIFTAPVAGDTFTIAGVTGTYTIATLGVSYSSSSKQATLTLTTSLSSSPADKAAVTFTSQQGIVKGVAAWEDRVVAVRNNDVYSGNGTGWSKINTPSYGTVLVNGAGQSGSTIAMDGFTVAPRIGDTFTIAGVAKIYTVLADATLSSGAATLSITPALTSSPADNAAVSWLSINYSNGVKLRTAKYRISSTERIIGVDGYNYPFVYDGTTFTVLNGLTDLLATKFAVWHKNQMFFAKDDKLVFTAPLTDNDFSAANGAGILTVGGIITGLIVFRETLIIFTEKTISQLTGNTLSDFVLQPITRKVGCVAPDTIQEIGGDVLFLGSDGLRLLGATQKNNDFSLGLVSKPIQKEITDLISASSSFASVIIKHKSQYRIFGYNESITSNASKGVLGTQMSSDNTADIDWAELRGIRAYVADSDYKDQTETIVFAHDSGYVYKMESGNSFDGQDIYASFATPYVHLNDPRVRKTFYKLFLYTDPQGSITTSVNMKLDFDTEGSIQPNTIVLSNDTGTVGFYGTAGATYGSFVYGSKLKKLFQTQMVGSGFSVSLQFVSNSQSPPYSLDAATLEFGTHDRR